MPGEQLHVGRRTRERAPAHMALAVLLVVVFAVGWAQRESWNGTQPVAATTAAAPTGSLISGSAVPAPPEGFTAAAARTRGGLHVFLASAALDRGSAASLFGFYLQAMPSAGWTLLGKGDPSKTGDWTQRWQRGEAAALLTVTTRPADSFTIELCPPDPYC